jgi:transcriptional regulator with XRE-family HTH domain
MGRSTTNSRERARLDLRAIGRRIRELRGFEMTQDECARRIGITSHLSALERGDSEPDASVPVAISREFGKSVDWLLTGEEKIGD